RRAPETRRDSVPTLVSRIRTRAWLETSSQHQHYLVLRLLRTNVAARLKIAIVTSTTPSKFENVCTLRKLYIQLINGLCVTKGSIPFASYPVNFIRPIHPTTNTRP